MPGRGKCCHYQQRYTRVDSGHTVDISICIEPDDGGMAQQSDANRAYSRRLAAESIAAGDPTGWFERLYAAAERGQATVPWADLAPNPNMVAALADISGLPDQPVLSGLPGMTPVRRERALVVGCGL